MMKTRLYKIETQSSMKAWTHREYKLFDSDKQAENYVRNLTEERGHNYRYNFLQDLKSEMTEETPQVEDDNEGDIEELKDELSEIEWAEDYNEDEFPRGWWLNKEFVAKDGTVFDRKEIQPDKYRTIPPAEY